MPGDPAANLDNLFKEICIEYKKNNVNDRYSKLTPTMIKQAKAKLPLLKGKAGKVKAFGSVLIIVFRRLMNQSDPKHHLILRGLEYSVRIDRILHEYKYAYRYPQHIADQFEACCFDYVKVTIMLINAYHNATPPVAVFNLTSKAHYLMHLGVCSQYTNPYFGSCYRGETLMQTCKQLTKASCNGTSALGAANDSMFRFWAGRAWDYTTANLAQR